jgi:nucleotide-binding universal stress UspA family protein
MFPKDIVVFLEEEAGRSSRLAYAAALARTWQAHLIATFIVNRLELDRHAGFAVGEGLTSMLSKHRADVADAIERTRRTFDGLVERHSFTGEWRVSENEVGEALMLHARHASLAIVGPPARRTRATTTLSLSEDVIFASGRPSLLLPIDWPADRIGRRIVVGWNAGREATRAIADAMPFLVKSEQVHLVVVPDAKVRSLYGADPGADIAQHLARHGVQVTLDQRKGEDAGAVLLDRCRAVDADMLVMGAVGRSRISEFVFGGATRTVLGTADLPILLSR